MATIIVTPKTTNIAVDTMASNFTTTSTSYVDVTDSSLSVPNGFSYAARIDFQNSDGGSTTFVRLLENEVQRYETSSSARVLRYSGILVNNTGELATVKLQARTFNSFNTATVYATGNSGPSTIIAYAPFGIVSTPVTGIIDIPIHVSLNTLRFLSVSALTVIGMGGSSVGSVDYDFTTVNINNVVGKLQFISPLGNIALLFDWSGNRIEVTP